jgi:FHA domain
MSTSEKPLPKWTKGTRLIGWFISYDHNSDGQAYEIREGRCFLGNAPLHGSRTTVIEDSSIGSPHAVMAASRDHTVFLQDVFSPDGTYIQRSGDTREQRIDGPVMLQHGDWVQFGKTLRFQVCLIDGPRD